MKKVNLTMLLILSLSIILFSSCAHQQPQIEHCLTGTTYGFWGGLWHGFIAVFTFIGHLFNSDIAVWAPNNNGGWYTFGFLIGVGAFTGTVSKSTSSSSK